MKKLAGFAGVAGRVPPSVMSGLSNTVQLAAPASPIGLLCEQLRKVNELYALSQFLYTNCDHHILLIITGNADKESCHKLLLILVREQ